jgi:hypothetical protein
MRQLQGSRRNPCNYNARFVCAQFWHNINTSNHNPNLAFCWCERTAVEWFKHCGYRWRDIRKGVYKDGHDREDVVKYRNEVFLPRMVELEPTFVKWELQEATPTEPERLVLREPDPSYLPPGVRPRLPCTHDECSFNSTDGQHKGWVHEEHIPFFNKGRGQGMMASEFVTPGDGNLKLPEDLPDDSEELPLEPDGDRFRECTQIMEFGKDNYWTCERMLEQLENLTIPLFEKCYPNYQAVFLFDNATNHAAYDEAALRAEKLNLGPGGEQARVRDGFNPRTNRPQKMQHSDGTQKGMETILRERELWPAEGLLAQCTIANPNPGAKTKRVLNPECIRPTDGRRLLPLSLATH